MSILNRMPASGTTFLSHFTLYFTFYPFSPLLTTMSTSSSKPRPYQQYAHPDYDNHPSCMNHPRSIFLGCLLFSFMLSCTILMDKNRRLDFESTGLERPWEWPDMDHFTTTISSGDYSVDPNSADTMALGTQSTATKGSAIKTWDVNDPALSLGTFLTSPAWKDQSLIPGSDFVNFLRVLRPVDQAFYVHLFSNQTNQKTTIAIKQDTINSSEVVDPPSLYAGADSGCGPWIQGYIDFQNGVLDRTLPPHYTIHSCSDKPVEASTSDPLKTPCGNLFSQMVAMTAAFSWSVTESRGFFLRPDQVLDLQESFHAPLVQPWASPPEAESRSKINTEGWTDEYLANALGLSDPLVENDDKGVMTDERQQSRLRGLRSKSRNRASFGRDLSNARLTRDDAEASVARTPSITQKPPKQRQSASTRQTIAKDLEQGGLELVLNRDILPQLVNTTRTLSLFQDLGLPLPYRILQQSQEQINIIRVGKSHPVSSAAASESLSNAYHAAIRDSDDPSRIQAVPKTFGCMLDILIQPHIHLQQLIHPYATLFQLPAIFSVGIYIQQPIVQSGRRGNTKESSHSPAWSSVSRDHERIVDRYLLCARQIAREFAPKRQGQKTVFVVVSEDVTIARAMESQETWDEEVITPNWVTPKDSDHHPHLQKHPMTDLTKQQRAVLENWILSKTDYQVVSDHSDFAKVAVWRTRRENRSVMIQDNPHVEQWAATEPDFVDMLDCGTLLRNRPGSN